MRYHLSVPEPQSHLLRVEATLERPGAAAELCFPVWTPGSYLVREFARHVEGLTACDEDGRPLQVERVDKHRVRIATGGGAQVTLRYRVYANDLTVRTCHVDGTHAYLNGAAVFPYTPGRLGEPCQLTVEPPPGWKVATALAGGPTAFSARDYDELCDSPLEVGTHRLLRFTALGKPHELAVWGRARLDEGRLLGDAQRIVEALGGLMGGLPYERYLFILHLSDRRRGGLEHGASTTLSVGRGGFYPREAYEETLSLIAHEFFHLWNVKRLRPAAFTPYDYAREQYTRLLWWFEGVTSYYDQLTLVRAGLTGPRRYLRSLGQALTTHERTPGARKMSAEEASFLAWVKLYRPDENTGNSAVSYYLKGELVALSLDLALRGQAGPAGSLDALLRTLYARHAEGGLPEDGVERAVAEVLGPDAARAFFDRYVRGVAPLAPELGRVGLRLRRRAAQGWEDKGGTPARGEDGPGDHDGEGGPGWLGAELAAGPKLVVQSVREGSPAWRAGLCAEDEVVAEDGFRVERGGLWDRLCQEGPGGRLRLTVFRRDALVEVEVTLGPSPADTVWLEPDPAASPEARAAFRDWCGAAFEDALGEADAEG
jgi:predicted metalloprotease with PDZ domain